MIPKSNCEIQLFLAVFYFHIIKYPKLKIKFYAYRNLYNHYKKNQHKNKSLISLKIILLLVIFFKAEIKIINKLCIFYILQIYTICVYT